MGLSCASGGEHAELESPRGADSPLVAEALVRDVRWLVHPGLEGRGAYEVGGRRAAQRVAAEMRKAGLSVVRQPIRDGADNILGVLPGERAEAVIVSAHYDHLGTGEDGEIYPGADDNASGVAVMLGMARAAVQSLGEPERTIIFAAFGAEEPGLVGSGVYVRDPLVPLADTVAVLNFDMVGRHFFEAGSGKPATAAVVGLGEHRGARRAAHRAASAAGLELVEAPPGLAELFGWDGRTDDWRFRRRGVLSLHFSTAMHDDYHRPTDTADKLVPAQMERIAKTAFAVLGYFATTGAAGDGSGRESAHHHASP